MIWSWWNLNRARSRAPRAGAQIVHRAVRLTVEPLERRALLAAQLAPAYDIAESEPNDTVATADLVTASATQTVIQGTISNAADVDFFQFTIGTRSGVFLDVDSINPDPVDPLDALLRVYHDTGSGLVEDGSNDEGRDFDTIALNETSATQLLFGDPALYLDLDAGTYFVELSAPATSGDYQLKLTADALYSATVPVFASLPGATDTIYLDFDGHSATDAWNNGGPYTIPAYSLDAAAATFSPGERLAIYNTWRVVADAFAPFNINVTTSYSGVFDDGIAHRQVIGNSNGAAVGHAGSLGVAWVNGYNSGGPQYKTGFTFANNFPGNPISGISERIVANAIEMGNTSAHEVGHTMGLGHYTSTPMRSAFLYVNDFGLNRERWGTGTNSSGLLQDDLATIASPTNTFGYRSDDHGNTRPAATVLGPAGTTYSASGVIHQTSDVDVFRFNGSGATTVMLDIPEHLGHLDARLYLYDAAGALLATAEPADTLGGTIAMSLPAAGDYYVEVHSDGGYGDLGMYDLRISTIAAPTGAITGRVFRDVTLNHSYQPGGGDTPLGGVTVYLDTDNDNVLDVGEQSITSSLVDGTFSFTGLANGAYNVKQVTPDGYVSNISYSPVISNGETYANINFGNFDIEYVGSAGSDTYTVRLNAATPSMLEIVESFSGLTYTAPRVVVPSLTFDGGGGGGTDTLIVHGTAVSDAIAVAGATITGAAANNIGFNGFEALTVDAGNGDDLLAIAAAPAAPVQFHGGTNAGTTDTLNIEAGTYAFDADARNTTAKLVVNVSGVGASAIFNATQHLEALNLADGASASVATSGAIMLVMRDFTMSGDARMDLRDNDMIIHAGDIGSFDGVAYDGVTGYVASAYNFTSWDGNGLATSMEAAGPNSGTTTLAVGTGFDVYGLGPADEAEWQGETITGSSVIVKYTYAGDVNFDGLIDGADYGTIDNWVQFPGTAGHANGDLNFDGVIDGADYGVIDNSVQFQGLPL